MISGIPEDEFEVMVEASDGGRWPAAVEVHSEGVLIDGNGAWLGIPWESLAAILSNPSVQEHLEEQEDG